MLESDVKMLNPKNIFKQQIEKNSKRSAIINRVPFQKCYDGSNHQKYFQKGWRL